MQDYKNKCDHDWDIEIMAPNGDCVVNKYCRKCGIIISQILQVELKED